MAILRVEIDIDSEVHPELYARLASLDRLPAREEKLRQLAATGLIWEIQRMHGPAFAEPADSVAAPAAVEAGALEDHPAWRPADVPLLVDIVADDEAEGGSAPAVDLPADLPGEAPPAAGPASRHEGPIELADGPPPAPESSGRTRSARLKRMKDLGLFQNG